MSPRPEAHQGRVRRAQRSARWRRTHSTVEELHLLAKLMRGLGSENIDHRLRHADFRHARGGNARWLGMPIARCRSCSARWSSARSCARTIRCSRAHPPGGAQGRADPQPPRAARRLADAAGADASSPRRAAGCVRWPSIAAAIAAAKGVAAPLAARSRPTPRRPSPRRCCPASARRSCWAMRPRSIRRRAHCWRWRTGSASRPARRSAT